MSDLTAKQIKSAVRQGWENNHSTFLECNLGSAFQNARRVDVAALEHTWAPPCVKIAEVKVSRSDFLNDRKWTHYQQFCNEFYWACPTGLISRGEVSEKAGLIMVNPKSRKATVVKKAVYREPSAKTQFLLLYYILTWRKNPDGGVTREKRMDRIRREMRENHELGSQYRQFVSNKLQEAEREVRAAKRERRDAERRAERAESAEERMENRCRKANELAGIILECRPDMDSEQLKTMLRSQPYNMLRSMGKLRKDLAEMIQALGGEVDE